MTKFTSWYKILTQAICTMLATMLVGCSDDSFDIFGESEDVIKFQIVREGASRSESARAIYSSTFNILTSPESPDSLYLYSQVSDFPAMSAQSRGALTSEIGNYIMSCTRTSGSDFLGYYFKEQVYTPEGDNQSGRDFYWMNTGTQDYTFYGVAPADKFGTAYNISYPTPDNLPVITYTVSQDPTRQIDLLGVTTTPYPDTYKQVVPVQFKHLTTGIVFTADASVFPGTIKKITIEGVKASGTYDMASGEWTLSGAPVTYVYQPNKLVTPEDNEITPDGEATFFLMPQTLGEGAKVTVDYENAISHASYSLSADLSGMVWPMGKVVNFVISTSGITATQQGLSIVGTADSALLPAKISLKALNGTTELLNAPISISAPGFSIPAPDFIDNLIEAGLTGERFYVITVTSDNDQANHQELMLEYKFDYMAFTVDVDDTSIPIALPFDPEVAPQSNPSTIMVRWDPNDYTNEFTTVTLANRMKYYTSNGERQIRIYSNLHGDKAVPEYRTKGTYRYNQDKNNQDFSVQTVSMDTKLLSSPNTQLQQLFLDCKKLTSVPANLFEEFGKIESIVGAFQSCYVLQTIPDGLFDSLTNVTNFTRIFQECRQLQSIPSGLFDNCTEATEMAQMFNGCYVLQEIPEHLFDHNTKVVTFTNVFQNCQIITSIPDGLFDHCPNVTDFSYAFQSCFQLQAIQGNLFAQNTKVEAFNNTFQHCRSLQVLPEQLFSNCQNVTKFAYTFASCTGLTAIPVELFANCRKVVTFEQCFGGCTSVASVDAGLFQASQNVTNFSGVFQSSGLTSIPQGLFAHMSKVTTFKEAFANCGELLTFPDDLFSDCEKAKEFTRVFNLCRKLQGPIPTGFFQNCDVANIADLDGAFNECLVLQGPLPTDLFHGMTKLKSLNNTFYYCRSLISEIPPTLFSTNVNLTDMINTFAYCNNLYGVIPDGIFANNTKLSNMYRTFIDCNRLTKIPQNIFANCPDISNLTATFNMCVWIHGNVPELWLTYPSVPHESCFYRVGVDEGHTDSYVTNYDAIPEGWKGADYSTMYN